jgi:hypothetical protein
MISLRSQIVISGVGAAGSLEIMFRQRVKVDGVDCPVRIMVRRDIYHHMAVFRHKGSVRAHKMAFKRENYELFSDTLAMNRVQIQVRSR